MNKLFYLQLMISFFVGGGVIALLSFIAERVNARVAGIVLAFPSTVALSFFFLGWALTPEAVANIVPATFIPLGLTVLFPAIYTYTAEFLSRTLKNKILQIVVSFFISLATWALLSLPIAFYKFNNLMVGVTGYAILALLAHWLLHRRNHKKPTSLTYTFSQKIGRAAFVGLIITLVVFLGKTFGPFWGGMLAVFPAALSSSIVILHWYYDPKSLFPTVQKYALGSVAIAVYSLTVMLVFPKIGFIFGTIVAYLASLVTSLLLAKIPAKHNKSKTHLNASAPLP